MPAVRTLNRCWKARSLPTRSYRRLTAWRRPAGCRLPGSRAATHCSRQRGKFDGEAWLYTDGDSGDFTSPEQMRLFLNERRVRGSIALLGGCCFTGQETAGCVGRRAHLSEAGCRRFAVQRHRALSADGDGHWRPVYLCRAGPAGQRGGHPARTAEPYRGGRPLERLCQQLLHLPLGPPGTVGIPVVPGGITGPGCGPDE